MPEPIAAIGAWLTVEEAASQLRVSRSLVYDLIRRGELPGIRLGRLWRVPAAALTADFDPPTGPSARSSTEIRLLPPALPPGRQLSSAQAATAADGDPTPSRAERRRRCRLEAWRVPPILR